LITFKLRDMFSSRSAGTIVKSVKALDSGARVRVNMETFSVEISPKSRLTGAVDLPMP
jgi:hypothetical protein